MSGNPSPRRNRARAPLSYAQRAIWRAEQVTPGTALHTETAAFRLTGPVDAAALERAVAQVVARHEVLRCAVADRPDGEPCQVFSEGLRPPLERADLSALPEHAREARLAELLAEVAATPFDLARAPLMRAHLFRLGDQRHVLLLTAHHLVADAWTLGVFLEAMGRAYAALTGGAEPAPAAGDRPSGAPRVDFGDYAAWQRSDPDPGRHLDYWRTRLHGEPAAAELAAEPRPVPAPGADEPAPVAGALHHFTVPAGLTGRLSAFARAEVASLPAVVLTAFCAVVQRYTGQDDLVVGMPVATRGGSALTGMMGPLLNVMPYRADLTGQPTFREALARTRRALKADLRHRDTPFDLIVEDLGAAAGADGTPLFRLMYAFHNGPATTPRLPGVRAVPEPSHSGTAKYQLSLFLRPRPGGELDATVEYRTASLSARTVSGFADALLCLLGAAVADPDRPLAELPVMSAAEHRRVVTRFATAGAAADTAPPPAVPAVLRALAREDAAAPAVTCSGRTLSRAEVDAAADRVAARLAAVHRTAPGDRVVLDVARGAALVPLILGLWRAGAVLVPSDEALPPERAAHAVRDSGARLLVTDRPRAAADLSWPAGLPVADPAGLLAAGPAGPVPFPDGPGPRELAYLMYTSGSTGVSKGVAVPHGCVANLLHSVVREPGLGPADVLVAVTSPTFDISVLELFAPLVAGGRVVVAERETVRDAAALGALLEDSGATVLQATPSLWRGLLDGHWPGRRGLRAFSGGEALDPDLAARLLDRCDELWNLYGPTETTIWSTAGRVRRGEPVTVGRPVARTTAYVLDRHHRPVPPGAVGQLVIGGAGVSAGYWRRAELTAASFVDDPVDPEGGVVYLTGDLARHLPDGRLVVLGRADQQVKLLGHRLELGELEAVLGAHPEVRAAAVVLSREQPGGPRLAAFAALRDGAADRDPVPELLGLLRRRLPAGAPVTLTAVPELPLNTSGKVDRPAVARMARELPADRERVPLATAAERALAPLWAEALGGTAERVGRTDDFLAAGGNSIAATRLLTRVRAVLGGAPSLARFYTDPTVAGLARAAAEHAADAPAPPLAAAPADAVPLTDQQRQLWLAHRLDPDSAAYHLAAAVRLDGPVDVRALDLAVTDLAARHETLGARCELRDGTPVLVLRPAAPVRLAVVDAAEAAGGPRLDALATAEATRPFDLATGPLLRATLVRAPDAAPTLLVTAHHLAVDGWSIGVVVRDLAALYAARTGAADPPPAPGTGFAAYAAARTGPAAEAAAAEQLAHWTERLRGHPGVLDLPAEPGLPAARRDAGGTVPVALPPDLTALLRRTAAHLRTTPFTVLLTVFAALLGRYAGSDDVVVGVPTANRERPELDTVVGSLVNTLPVRVDLSGTPAFAELAARTGRTLAADLDRPLVPFDRLVSALGLARDPDRPALVQAALVVQEAPPRHLRLGDVGGRLTPVPTGTAKYALTLALDEHADRFDGHLEYAGTRFGPAFAERVAGHLLTLLRAALADPGAPLDAVSLADRPVPAPEPAEEPGAARGRHAVPVHELFRRRAAATPDAVAVSHAGADVGYRRLDAWSDLLAARLRDAGAAPGRFVAVLAPTGPAQAAAVLGVAKAGAAFAVLDPADPDQRLRAVLRDADPVCVLAAEAPLAARGGLCDPAGERLDGVPVVALGTRPPERPLPAAPPEVAVRGDDPLCLVHTSGSTGAPKGIVLSHATLAQFAHWQRERFAIRPDSRIAQWAPFTYDAAYTEVFAALCSGARLCVPRDEVRGDPVALAEWLGAERVTQIQTVPAFFQLVTEALDAAGRSLPDLEHVLLAGEVLPVALAEAWADRPDRPRLHNLYGPTECVLATHRELAPGERFPGSVPIGAPIPGRQALVLDHRGRPCPVGVTGEIHLRSDFLADGYHRRPAETAAAYVPDPWRPGGRLYRTGDLGYWRPDGELAFLGRTGGQVKIRGNRVELEGIEALLEAHPRVREAAAAAHGTGTALRLVGYAVADGAVTGAELRAHLARHLPAPAVPDTVVLLDALPRTRTNKRDRARLPVPGAPVDAAPREGVEQIVADAWRHLLGGRPVGRHTNFFEAGGDSLLAARLQLELTRRLGRPVRLVEVFARPTVAEFAAGLTGGARDRAAGTPGSPAPGGPGGAEPRGGPRRAAVRRG
ncbi:amino acid adenylation domain-containing protein, partial [Streptomyces capparidis]